MDSKSRIIEKINSFLPFLNEEFLISISNKGTYKRSIKDLEKMDKENINIDLDENDNLKIEFEDIKIVLNENIQNSLCSCPASGICKHILIGLLSLEEFAKNNNEKVEIIENDKIENDKIENSEKQKNTETISTNNESSKFEQLKELTSEKLLEMIGKKTYNSLIKSLFIRDDSEFKEEETLIIATIKTQNIRIYFPQEKTLENSMCSCKEKGICSHKAYVLISYLIKNGKLTEKNFEDEEIKIEEKELKFIDLIQNFIASIFNQGISSLSEIEIEKAEKYYIQAYGLGFFSLAEELKNLSSELRFYFEKNIAFSNEKLLHILSTIFNRVSSLKKIKEPMKLSILAGKRQEEKFNLNSLEIVGIGASANITKRHDLLITSYFYSKDLKMFLSMSTLRPFENVYQLKILFNMGSVWSDEFSYKMVSNSKFILKNARLSMEKISSTKTSKANFIEYTEENDIIEIAVEDYSEILNYLKKNKFKYFERYSQKSNIFLVKVDKIENVFYDEISQKLKFECYDKKNNKIEFSINYSPITSKIIEIFEKKEKLKFDYILGRLQEKNDEIFGVFLDSISEGKIENWYFK